MPKDEPRFDTLRESPEMSPWSASGKLDCTIVTDDVSITPTPRPMSSSAGDEGPDGRVGPHQGEQQAHADGGHEEARDDQPPLRTAAGQPLGAGGGGQDADRGRASAGARSRSR